MHTVRVVYCSNDAMLNQFRFLEDFKDLNIHPEHDGDIDKVKYEMSGDNAIKFTSEDLEALNYVVGFATEEEDCVSCICRESSV